MAVDVLGALRGKILFEQGWNADPDMCRVVVGAFGQSAEPAQDRRNAAAALCPDSRPRRPTFGQLDGGGTSPR